MKKTDNKGLILIICGIIAIFISPVICSILGGLSKPYVPSILVILILISVVIFYLGLKKSAMDIRDNILIILILLVSAILTSMFISNMNANLTIYNYILIVMMIVLFVITLLYIISLNIDNIPLRNKLSVIGDNSKFLCLGVIIVFFVIAFLSNSVADVADEQGYFTLEKAEFAVTEPAKTVQTGYWVYTDTGEPTGEKEYTTYGAKVEFEFRFNLDNITWNGKGISINELKNQINNKSLPATVYLYDENGDFLTRCSGDISLDNNKATVTNGTYNRVDSVGMDNVKYAEVQLIGTDNSFRISSNRYAVQ